MWLICLKYTSSTFTSLSPFSHLSYSYELCVSIFKKLSLASSHNTIHSVWCQIYSCLVDDFNDMLKKVKEWEPAYTSPSLFSVVEFISFRDAIFLKSRDYRLLEMLLIHKFFLRFTSFSCLCLILSSFICVSCI